MKKREKAPALEQLSVRLTTDTLQSIHLISEALGIHSDAMMIRLLLEDSLKIVEEVGPPTIPPILAASRDALQNLSAKF